MFIKFYILFIYSKKFTICLYKVYRSFRISSYIVQMCLEWEEIMSKVLIKKKRSGTIAAGALKLYKSFRIHSYDIHILLEVWKILDYLLIFWKRAASLDSGAANFMNALWTFCELWTKGARIVNALWIFYVPFPFPAYHRFRRGAIVNKIWTIYW